MAPISLDEIGNLKAKRRAEHKFELLEQRYKEEMLVFNEARVEQILGTNGVSEYFDKIKTRIELKDDIIKNLKEELEQQNNKLAELHNRCNEAEKKSQEYLEAWKGAWVEHRAMNTSSASSMLEQYSIPRPPPIEAPSISEIFLKEVSPRYMGLNSSIPPPPEIDVSVEEILEDSLRSLPAIGNYSLSSVRSNGSHEYHKVHSSRLN